MTEPDILIIGSGCSGAMAAQTLVESGARVLMLDGGEQDEKYSSKIPDKDFESVRAQDKNQHIYFLGENFESLQANDSKAGAQLTPSRKHIVRLTDEYLKYNSGTFSPVESLAYGGLGAGWGLGCCVYSEEEIKACGLDDAAMKAAYETIAGRIGISAAGKDESGPYTIGGVKKFMAPVNLDVNAQLLFHKHKKKSAYFKKYGFSLGRPALALLSEDYNGRKATRYDDMHFYRDAGDSAYRPGLTIDELRKKQNFAYEKNQLVVSFVENSGGVEVSAFNTVTKQVSVFKAKKLVLAAGALSTARIVLRSVNSEKRISFLCNPYTYYPCLQWKMVGKEIERNKTGLCQLSLFHDPDKTNFNVAMASLYTYRSLFLFRLLNEVPLNFKDAKEIMRFLLSGIVIMGIHHPDSFSSNRFMQRVNDSSSLTGDNFNMEYILNAEARKKITEREKLFVKMMRSLGAWALKRVEPAMGASIHYAGTLPFSKEEKELTLSHNGRLHGTKNVFVADSSGFTYLPAKGLTFSLMANAHNVALSIKNT
jgi:hypothetical protein